MSDVLVAVHSDGVSGNEACAVVSLDEVLSCCPPADALLVMSLDGQNHLFSS